MNQSFLLQNDNDTRLLSKPISSNKSSDVMNLVRLSEESAETLDYFAAIHQSKEFTKQTALDLFAGVTRSK